MVVRRKGEKKEKFKNNHLYPFDLDKFVDVWKSVGVLRWNDNRMHFFYEKWDKWSVESNRSDCVMKN